MTKPLNDPDPRRPFGPLWYGEQNEDGIDLSLIRENLKLTPTERARLHDAMLRDIEKWRKHARRVQIRDEKGED